MLVPVRTGPAAAAGADSTRRASLLSPEVVLLSTVIVVGAAVRFSTLGSQSYWTDEATTVHELHMSLGGLLHQVRINETTPPLYFVVAWLWAKVFGTGEVGLRSLSALLGIVLIPVAYLCGRELVSRAAGLVAAALVAVSPYMVWYSQEARSYMMFAVFSGLSFLFCARAWTRRSSRDVAWWAVWSALAVLTHFFAMFLVAPEAVMLIYRLRKRATLIAVGAVALVQLAVAPLAISDTSHPLNWIQQFPLSVRIKQVPVDLGLSRLFQSPILSEGLLIAAVTVAVVVAMLAIWGGPAERRGAAFAAVPAAVVLLAPILLALLGSDYVVSRNMIPAWIPLAVIIAATCTVPRARLLGAGLAIGLMGVFVWAGIRIDGNPQYQRPDWRGVAQALGHPSGTRAIVAYDGFAAQPLGIYLRGVPWLYSPPASADVSEVAVVGNPYQVPARGLPPGTKLISTANVHGLVVERFAVAPAWRLNPPQIGRRINELAGVNSIRPLVLIQRPSP